MIKNQLTAVDRKAVKPATSPTTVPALRTAYAPRSFAFTFNSTHCQIASLRKHTSPAELQGNGSDQSGIRIKFAWLGAHATGLYWQGLPNGKSQQGRTLAR